MNTLANAHKALLKAQDNANLKYPTDGMDSFYDRRSEVARALRELLQNEVWHPFAHNFLRKQLEGYEYVGD
jgi:hypothetical protein